MNFTIRNATPADASIIARYNSQIAEETEDGPLDPAIIGPGVEKILANSELGRYWVAEADGQVIGQIMVTFEWSDWRDGMMWWIQSVYVAASHRRTGVFSALYRHALAALQPSWEEGFGLPILEAMGHGCPVITAGCSAPPEIVGEAGILVDPAKPAQSRQALERLLDDQFYRRRLIDAGRARASHFTWENYFATLSDAYQRLL